MKPLHLFSAAAIVAVALVVAALVISRPNATDETSPEVTESSPTASPTQPVVVRVEQDTAPEVGDEISISLRGIDAGVVATLEVGDELVAESAGSGTLTWTPKEAGLFELTVRVGDNLSIEERIEVAVVEPEPVEQPAVTPPTTIQPIGRLNTLDAVLDRGHLICGVSGRAAGFSETLADGSTTGLDADICRAIAAAITGDAANVEFVNLTSSQRFGAVTDGLVDIVSRYTVPTASRDSELGIDFGPVVFYDGQHFMGRAGTGVRGTSDLAVLDNKSVCVTADTTTEAAVLRVAEANQLRIEIAGFDTFEDAMTAFSGDACDFVTTDITGLLAWRDALNPTGDWVIFPGKPLNLEPLAPFFRDNDSDFAAVVDWTINAMFLAAEHGVTSADVTDVVSDDLVFALAFMLGSDEIQVSNSIGLPPDAFFQVISQVGNYNEVFDRNLRPLGVTREGSLNAVWTEGGLLHSPPMR